MVSPCSEVCLGSYFNVFTNKNMCSNGYKLHIVVKFALYSVCFTYSG